MLEFKITIDTEDDIVKVTGPTNLVLEEQVWSIEDMCEVFKHYMLEFCKKVHFDDYRIDAIHETEYVLSKDNKGTRSEWDYISSHSRYIDAFEKMCNLQYKDSKCLAGFTDCIFADEEHSFCKVCASNEGCYYDYEDK
jgi:hypothetical protein